MRYSVVVVGSGFAGLSAVARLRNLGISNIIVLEARTDVGGRVRMTDFCGVKFNIGPEWLHGQTSNPIYHLAKNQLGLQVKNSNNYRFYFNYPENLSVKQRENEFKSLLENLEQSVDDLFFNSNDKIYEKKSVFDIISKNHDKKGNMEKFVDFWAFNYENGTFPECMSALIYKISSSVYKNVPAFSDFYFEQKNGFLQIIKYYQNLAHLNDNNIKFNDPVSQIYYGKNDVEVFTKQGKHYEADYCICAVPVSIISKQIIKIKPELDQDIHKTIRKLKFSTYSRIFVELDKPIWMDNFEWFVDLSGDFQSDLILWQNTMDNSSVLIAHQCNNKLTCNNILQKKIENSLGNIMKNDFKGVKSFKLVTLENCPYSLGAFPCASPDFDLHDAMVLKKMKHLDRLLFAGDSYELEYFGTVQGAVKSGMDAGNSIYQRLNDHERIKNQNIM